MRIFIEGCEAPYESVGTLVDVVAKLLNFFAPSQRVEGEASVDSWERQAMEGYPFGRHVRRTTRHLMWPKARAYRTKTYKDC